MIIPRAWFLPCTLMVVMGIVVLWIDGVSAGGGPGFVLGVGIIGIGITGFIFGIAVRQMAASLSPAAEVDDKRSVPANVATWSICSIALAVVATHLCVLFLNATFDSGAITHVGIGFLALAWFLIVPFVWQKGSHTKPKRGCKTPACRAFRWGGAVTVLLLLVWSVKSITTVTNAAESAALGQPYCISVSAAEGLRPARSYWDLSGFFMQARGRSIRHAALTSGKSQDPNWLYWSYRRGAFETEFMGWPVSCELKSGFAKALTSSQKSESGSTDTTFWLGGGQWRLPAEYRGSGADRPPVLSFYARGKHFTHLDASLKKQVPDMDLSEARVSVTLCSLETLHVWHRSSDTNHIVKSDGTYLGLQKQSVESRGASNKEFQYLDFDSVGRASTWLLCHQGTDVCRHAFRREGVVVEFQHPLNEFAQWKQTQDALWGRIKSFAVVWPESQSNSCSSGRN